MTVVAKSFQFVRPSDLEDPDEEPEDRVIEINGTSIRLAPTLPSIDVVRFAVATVNGGSDMVVGIDRLFRQAVDSEDYERFVGVLRDLDLSPAELAQVAQGIVEVFTERPTSPS